MLPALALGAEPPSPRVMEGRFEASRAGPVPARPGLRRARRDRGASSRMGAFVLVLLARRLALGRDAVHGPAADGLRDRLRHDRAVPDGQRVRLPQRRPSGVATAARRATGCSWGRSPPRWCCCWCSSASRPSRTCWAAAGRPLVGWLAALRWRGDPAARGRAGQGRAAVTRLTRIDWSRRTRQPPLSRLPTKAAMGGRRPPRTTSPPQARSTTAAPRSRPARSRSGRCPSARSTGASAAAAAR